MDRPLGRPTGRRNEKWKRIRASMQPDEIEMIMVVPHLAFTWLHTFSPTFFHLILITSCKGHIRPFNKYISSTYYVPTTLPGAREPMTPNKPGSPPLLQVLPGQGKDRQHTSL